MSKDPTNVVFTPGAADVADYSLTVPYERPPEPTEADWVRAGDGEEAVLKGNQLLGSLPLDRSAGTFRNPKVFIGQELVGTFDAGDEFAVVAVDDTTVSEHPLREYVLTRVSKHPDQPAEVVGRIPNASQGRPLLIGRNPDSDSARLSGQSAEMSRRHAEVSLRNGQVVVRDLGSANHTTIKRPLPDARRRESSMQPAWAMSEQVAEEYRPAVVEALPDAEAVQVVGEPDVTTLHSEDRQELARSEVLRGRRPLETRAMMLQRYGLPASRIATVELSPHDREGSAGLVLHVLDRGTRHFEHPRQFVPGDRPQPHENRYVVVTDEFLRAAETARATGDFHALRNHPGMHVVHGHSGSVELGTEVWGLAYNGGQRSEISRRHASISISGGGGEDLPTVRVTDRGSLNGTRITVPREGSAVEVRNDEPNGLTLPLGQTSLSGALAHTRPYGT